MVLGLGAWEITLVGLALLVLFGPEHGPQAMRTLSRWRSKAKSTMARIEHLLEEEVEGGGGGSGFDPTSGFDPSRRPPEAEAWMLDPNLREKERKRREQEETAGENGDDGDAA